MEVATGLVLKPLDKHTEILKARQNLHQILHQLSGALSASAAKETAIAQQLKILVLNLGGMPQEKVKTKVPYTENESIPAGKYVTLCSVCNHTCHNNCAIPNDEDKAGCCAMKDGNCVVCPNKCPWTKHHNANYFWVPKFKTVEVTPQGLIDKWAGENGKTESAILALLNELELAQTKLDGTAAKRTSRRRTSTQSESNYFLHKLIDLEREKERRG